jgi:RNA polymerase-binding protein DksA
MNGKELEQYRTKLIDMRDRINGEVGSVVEAIKEENSVTATESSAPVHLADIANSNSETDSIIVEHERGVLDEVLNAIERIDSGDFGKCTECGRDIAPARLEALPYTPHCIDCAKKLAAA